ncbi:hypothetical protein MESS2_350080 [Mesorhizobium metallidurans STM 2683]|uniref:Uncharacterized protein n=1 Tax=Mesorhizobium metallidurans STM 2683 TaxID=1297569 RepID=M5ERM0_9HYPH|nr:hypothetical protein MESS2_350080 [Mesorhizobium metallidurans STM 2683]
MSLLIYRQHPRILPACQSYVAMSPRKNKITTNILLTLIANYTSIYSTTFTAMTIADDCKISRHPTCAKTSDCRIVAREQNARAA